MNTENSPLVSVIIPMYNTEKYIEECLQSLLNQTLKNFEVIVVDDCSTDNSLEIAQKFIAEFEKIEVKLLVLTISPNSGCPGIPRNIAMDYAKGKYIYFLDSDDFLDETVLEDFYKVAEEFNADVVHAEKCFEYKEIDGEFADKIISLESTAATETPTFEIFDIETRITDFCEKKYSTMIWHKFYRRDFLIDNDIKFPQLTISEDFIFSLMCVSFAKNYVRVPFTGYHYRKRTDSSTATPGTIVEASCNLIEGVYFLYNFMQRQKFFVENSKYQYLILDYFNQFFTNLLFKHIFFNMDCDPAEVFDFYCKKIFSLAPQKNIPLTSYLFVSTNIYRMLVNQQSLEIKQLKKLLQEK